MRFLCYYEVYLLSHQERDLLFLGIAAKIKTNDPTTQRKSLTYLYGLNSNANRYKQFKLAFFVSDEDLRSSAHVSLLLLVDE